MKINIFTKHPHSIGESYFEHFKFAALLGLKLIFAGIACLLHAMMPFILKKTASTIMLNALHDFIERVPVVETRVKELYNKIDSKINNNL